MADETVPKGVRREACSASAGFSSGGSPGRQARLRWSSWLFVAYGPAGRGSGRYLRLDDLDWENEIIRVRWPEDGPGPCLASLAGRRQSPFCATYGKAARPASGAASSTHRTLVAPSDRLAERPWARSSAIVSQASVSLQVANGTHALRHAAAQHLAGSGHVLEALIGDFLGHRDPSSTAIYAKVILAALREVAALDLEGLA